MSCSAPQPLYRASSTHRCSGTSPLSLVLATGLPLTTDPHTRSTYIAAFAGATERTLFAVGAQPIKAIMYVVCSPPTNMRPCSE